MSLKVILESSRSLRACNAKNPILTFLHINVKDADMKSLETYVLNVTGNICNTIDMAPGVNPTLQKWEIG
jgi:hypothetical protein